MPAFVHFQDVSNHKGQTMTELDVTHMIDDADDYPVMSGSIAELGSNASKITWNNSVAYGRNRPLLTTDELRDAARSHFREYGAWTQDEIAAWSEDVPQQDDGAAALALSQDAQKWLEEQTD
jgi:hypothetical protein